MCYLYLMWTNFIQISRHIYESQIDTLLWKSVIKIFTGQRRTGKSRLLQSVANRFDAYVLSIDCEYLDILQDIEHTWFHTYMQNKLWDWSYQALCIDEIQKIDQRELALLSIHREYPSLEIWITWSNSDLLASDLTTHLRGRCIQIPVYPFGYMEYCQYFWYEQDVTSFTAYLTDGGIPFLYPFRDDEAMYTLQSKNIIDTIFVRDIVERYNIQDIHLLRTLFQYLVNTAGNIFSAQAFLKYYNIKHKTTYLTLQHYLSYLTKAYMIYPVDIYNLEWKRIVQRQQKYYSSDHSWRKVLFSHHDWWYGKELENIVYIDALRHGRDVYVWKIWWVEVDFVLEKWSKKIYIQVTHSLSSDEVIAREFGNLEKIRDSYPKYVISMDPLVYTHPGGIHHLRFWEMDQIR